MSNPGVTDGSAGEDNVRRLRTAIHPFSGHPQAQRRWVQMGYMAKSAALLEEEAPRVQEYLDAGVLNAEEARAVEEMRAEYERARAGHPDLLHERGSEPRAYLRSAAFEEPEWKELRSKARVAFRVLGKDRAPLLET